jgi:hypothetical protein
MLHLNNRGECYDDGEPCYLSLDSGMLYNRITDKLVTYDSLAARVAEIGHTWANREIGLPSIRWQLDNRYGYVYVPNLADTSGLASEAVTNGEVWTGASGATPPTGWDVTGLSPDLTVSNGILSIGANAAGPYSISQDITVTPGTTYIIEVGLAAGTTGSSVSLDGLSLPVTGPANRAFSFTPTSATVTVALTIDDLTVGMFVDYVRCYEEAELTGAGGAVSGGTQVNPVSGPYTTGDVSYWIDSQKCVVGFNIDDDAEADVWLTWDQVDDADLSAKNKKAIKARLKAKGCTV